MHLLASGIEHIFEVDVASSDDWKKLDAWMALHRDWIFCWISYDAKNAIEKLSTSKEDNLKFPHLLFVVPQHVVQWDDVAHETLKGSWSEDFKKFAQIGHVPPQHIELKPRLSREEYITAVQSLLHEIQLGNIYEVNFCQEFFAKEKLKAPLATWQYLRSLTHAPFSAYVQHANKHVMCASPERFLKKTGSKIISQPIKGTIRRGTSEQEDARLKEVLHQSPKERSENVMIVDLVRNDLSKSAMRGSVKVEELFRVHTFHTVHHLISTVSADLKEHTSFTQIIRDTFPMGSMTGAPKIRAMQLIDETEHTARGLYSGTLGYITPHGDFDLNVIIRSLLYNDALPYLSLHVGGAITSQCEAKTEYEECLLKARAVINALGGSSASAFR